MITKLAQAKKALIAVVGIIAQAVSLGVFSGAVLAWAQVIIAAATALGVYTVKNAPSTA
jgi:hypothetical protein